jgi:hypothetical protein
VAVAGLPPIAGKTAAFAAPTPKAGVSGVLVIEPKLTRRADQTLVFGPEVAGTIPVVRGIADTEALVLAGQRAGAPAAPRRRDRHAARGHRDHDSGTPTPENG